MKRILKIVFPWLLCALIFYLLFRQFGKNGTLKPEDITFTLQQAHLSWLLAGAFIYFFVIMVIDCWSLSHFLGRFVTPIGFWETVRVRGVSYLLMIFNYGAGQGGFAIYLRKTRGASLATTLGAMLFVTATDALLTVTAGFTAVLLADDVNIGGVDLRSAALQFMPLIYAGFLLWVLFWHNQESPFVQRLTRWRWAQSLLSHRVFYIFREARIVDYARAFIWRAPLLVVVISGYMIAMMAFNAWIEPAKIFLYNPIMLFAGTVPITPSGLGTTQYLVILFFRDLIKSPLIDSGLLTPEKILLTSSLAWILLNQLYKALFGALCLNLTAKELFQDQK